MSLTTDFAFDYCYDNSSPVFLFSVYLCVVRGLPRKLTATA